MNRVRAPRYGTVLSPVRTLFLELSACHSLRTSASDKSKRGLPEASLLMRMLTRVFSPTPTIASHDLEFFNESFSMRVRCFQAVWTIDFKSCGAGASGLLGVSPYTQKNEESFCTIPGCQASGKY